MRPWIAQIKKLEEINRCPDAENDVIEPFLLPTNMYLIMVIDIFIEKLTDIALIVRIQCNYIKTIF